MTPTSLDRLWAILHRHLMLLTGGGSMKLDSDRVSSSPTESAPPPLGCEEVLELERHWENCRSTRAKKAVLKDAYELLLQHSLPNPDPKALRGTRQWKEIIARDPRSSREVGRMYAISHSQVLRYRKEFSEQ